MAKTSKIDLKIKRILHTLAWKHLRASQSTWITGILIVNPENHTNVDYNVKVSKKVKTNDFF